MNRKLIALIILAGCDPNKTEDEQTAYDEGYAQGYQDAADTLNADYAALEARLAAVEGQVDEIQPAVEDVQAQIDAFDDELTTSSGLPRFIDSDLTLDVPADYEDVNAALDALDGSVISPAATVTIEIAVGTYTYDEAITVDHSDGASIHIVGDDADPSAVVLDFVGNDGVVISQGKHLGYLGGVMLEGEPTGNDIGLHVLAASSAAWGPLVISDFGLAGVWVEDNGVLYPSDSQCTDDGINVIGGTYGTHVTGGGFANLCNVSVSQVAQEGIYATHGGVIFADNSQVSGGDNSFSAFDAYKVVNGAVLYAVGASASDVNDVGFEARHGASALLDDVTTSGGELGYYVGDGASMLIDNEGEVSGATYGYTASLLGTLMGTNLNASGYTGSAFRASRAGGIQVASPTCNSEACVSADFDAGALAAEGSIWY